MHCTHLCIHTLAIYCTAAWMRRGAAALLLLFRSAKRSERVCLYAYATSSFSCQKKANVKKKWDKMCDVKFIWCCMCIIYYLVVCIYYVIICLIRLKKAVQSALLSSSSSSSFPLSYWTFSPIIYTYASLKLSKVGRKIWLEQHVICQKRKEVQFRRLYSRGWKKNK